MFISTSFKPFVFPITTISFLASFALSNSADAAVLDFNPSDWETVGDIVVQSNSALMTNAFSDGFDDLDEFGNPVNFNISGNYPVFAFDVEFELGLEDGRLGLNSGDTSAIIQTFTVQAGDVLSFDWNFFTNHNTPEPNRNDYAFIAINNSIFRLADTYNSFTSGGLNGFNEQTGLQRFSYTFTTTGEYTIGIGIIDVGDDATTSALLVQAIPEPLTILGTGVALGFGAFYKKCLRKRLDETSIADDD